ncbi:hypothetical protein BKA64DRAFT_110050 [Cadophora sp. MPI-SDFR-AT-0126]|nr:hypothetical protein BKA64DRAFT_110050 [Leotiomycetes sp. MPI-SDFR-AT-0126]
MEATRLDLNQMCVFDTQKAAQHVLDLDHRCTMEEMLTLLDCPFEDLVLHTAGNDANFTLRALLLLAKRDVEVSNRPVSAEAARLLKRFAEVALAPVPLSDLQTQKEQRRQVEMNRKEARAQKQKRKRAALRAREREAGEKETAGAD